MHPLQRECHRLVEARLPGAFVYRVGADGASQFYTAHFQMPPPLIIEQLLCIHSGLFDLEDDPSLLGNLDAHRQPRKPSNHRPPCHHQLRSVVGSRENPGLTAVKRPNKECIGFY
jgi:hypothetical protein